MKKPDFMCGKLLRNKTQCQCLGRQTRTQPSSQPPSSDRAALLTYPIIITSKDMALVMALQGTAGISSQAEPPAPSFRTAGVHHRNMQILALISGRSELAVKVIENITKSSSLFH